MKRLLFFIIFLSFTSTVSAANLYVSAAAGCPGSGTTGAPYCAIQSAFNVANAGDVINIRNGTYDANSVLTRSGTNGNPITIQPDAGATPILRYTGNGADAGAIEIHNASYITVQNLNFNGAGIYTSAFAMKIQPTTVNMTNIQILNNTFQNWGGTGAQANSSNTRAALMVGEGYCPTPCSPNVQPNGTVVQGNTFDSNRQMSIFIQLALNTLIQNNTITNQKCGKDSDTGITSVAIKDDSSRDGGGTGTIVRGNSIHDFESYANCLSGGISHTGGAYDTMAALWCDVGTTNGLVEQNTVYNINGPVDNLRGQQESVGLFIEAGCSGWTVQKNVIYNVGGAGIRQRMARNQTQNKYYNNTIYKIGFDGIEMGNTGNGTGSATIENNIVMDAANAQILFDNPSGGYTFTMNYNLYFNSSNNNLIGNYGTGNVQNLAGWRTQCGCDANSKSADPLFVSTVTPDFHLQAGSPAINAGTNVGLPANGVPDMGAFESGTGVVTLTNDRFPGVTYTAHNTATWTTAPENTPLKPGINDVTVTATDVNGNAGVATRQIIYAPTFPGNTLVGAWAFDEGSGTTAADSSGNGNTGALINGATWVTGVHGTAISLDGVNQFVTVSGSINATLNYTQSFTFSAWVFPRSVKTDYRTIFEKSSSYGTIYGLFSSTSGYCGVGNIVGVVTTDGGFTSTASVCDPNPLPINQWTHLALTYDGTNLRLYRGGVLDQTTAKSGYIEPSTGSLAIGAHPTGVQVFDGLIEDARTYNWATPLTAGSNSVPGAACTFGNPLDPLQQSVVRDMNCPVIASTPPVFVLKVGPSATAIKIGPSSTAIKLAPQ